MSSSSPLSSSSSHHQCPDANSRQRSNQELSLDERTSKKNLKRALKLQSKRHKLQNRLRTATDRREHGLVEQTRRELQELERIIQNEEQLTGNGDNMIHEPNAAACQVQQLQPPRHWVQRIYQQLQARILNTSDNSSSSITKEEWRAESRVLLQNMTKATVDLDMFDNEAALWGYTSFKFYERAVLVIDSLAKLLTLSNNSRGETTDWRQRLTSIKTICSIGCGPGCDAVGVLALLHTVLLPPEKHKNDTSASPCCDPPQEQQRGLILLDWAMPQWTLILYPLTEILSNVTTSVDLAMCDVRTSLWSDPIHQDVRRHFFSGNEHQSGPTEKEGDDCTHGGNGGEPHVVDLFVISYLLSETRGQWHVFFDDVVAASRPGTMFLLTDPTAWQLHVFRKRYNETMEWQWLDSSMYQAELQILEGRVGPAVLLGVKL